MRTDVQLAISTSADTVAEEACGFFARWVTEQSGPWRAVLPGGTTPIPFFQALHGTPIDFSAGTLMLSDERLVPDTDPRSNTGLLTRELLNPLGKRAPELVPIASLDATRFLGTPGPLLAVLGLGEDGHTASIFPGLRKERSGNTFVIQRSIESHSRISLSMEFLLNCDQIMFLVTGEEKARALRNVVAPDLKGGPSPTRHLVSNFRGPVHIFCDQTAASLL